MSETAVGLPNLERLLRTVCRLSLEDAYGTEWEQELGATFRRAMERAGVKARQRRPDEPLVSDFDAVGLGDLASFLRSDQGRAVIDGVWESPEAARVDLDRLIHYRDKTLHAVGPPAGQIVEAEVAAIVKRLRVRLEAYRRTLMDETGEWWPYIETVTSNIKEIRFERADGGSGGRALLNEGDTVQLEVVGVNPNGPTSDLRYKLLFAAAPGDPAPEWTSTSSFEFVVPRIRRLVWVVKVRNSQDEGQDARGVVEVRPLTVPDIP